jgi:uncharacterized phiE125 gp8 family phage protein
MFGVNDRGEIGYSDSLIAGPTIEPIDLELVKKQRRFGSTSLDVLFDIWTSAARQHFEEMTGLQLLTATRCFALDAAPCHRRIQLGRAPVQSIESVTYLSSGSEVALDASNYSLIGPVGTKDVYPTLGTIELASSASWPTLDETSQSLRIYYKAGYGDAPGDVPELIKYALMVYVGAFHQHGEEVTALDLKQLPVGAQMVIQNAKYKALRTLIPRVSWPV